MLNLVTIDAKTVPGELHLARYAGKTRVVKATMLVAGVAPGTARALVEEFRVGTAILHDAPESA